MWQNFKRGLQPKHKQEEVINVSVGTGKNKHDVPIADYQKQVYNEELSKRAKEEARRQAIIDARVHAKRFASNPARRNGIINFLRGTPQQQKIAKKSLASSSFMDMDSPSRKKGSDKYINNLMKM